MDVGANAGKFRIAAFTDGSPIWCRISHEQHELRGISSDELYDLQYAVNRTIANIEREAKERERR